MYNSQVLLRPEWARAAASYGCSHYSKCEEYDTVQVPGTEVEMSLTDEKGILDSGHASLKLGAALPLTPSSRFNS